MYQISCKFVPFIQITFACFLLYLLVPLPSAGQNAQLSFSQAFEGGTPKLYNPFRNQLEWKDSESLWVWHRDNGNTQLIRVKATDYKDVPIKELQPDIDYEAVKEKLPEAYDLNTSIAQTKDYQKFLFNQYGNLALYNHTTQNFSPLTQEEADRKNPTFSPDGKKVAYTKNKDLYVLDLDTKEEVQITHDGSDVIYNGWASWVYYEEILGRASKYKAFWWSPNSEMISFLRFDDSEVPIFPIYNADGVHGSLEMTRYPKAGDPSPKVKLGVFSLKSSDLNWVDIDTTIEYTAWPFWTADSKELIYQQMNRDQNQLNIYAANPVTGEPRSVMKLSDPAWIEFHEQMEFLTQGKGFIIKSDVNGWAHLYHFDLEGNLINQLTDGDWQVFDIAMVDPQQEKVYFHADKGNSTEKHLFSVSLTGKALTQITQIPGTHNCEVSPDGSFIIDKYSSLDEPTEAQILDAQGEMVVDLHDSPTEEMDLYALGKVELFKIPTEDGVELPALWVLPPDFNPNQLYPVIFTIYGGPAAAVVRNSFQPLYKHYYAQNGIIVLAVDHRGSQHFGKKGQRLMHRNLSKWEMHDFIAAAEWLKKQTFIDTTKIGITGGSYGGYVTGLALTYGADHFTHGVSRAPVTDWRLYDNVYTERYMDHPADNPQGYQAGSVLTHANQYKGKLLLTHGTIDDNVHMQNSIQLVDFFTDHGKEFEFMLYPNERHGLTYPKRSHFYKISTKFWFKHFLEKEFPF